MIRERIGRVAKAFTWVILVALASMPCLVKAGDPTDGGNLVKTNAALLETLATQGLQIFLHDAGLNSGDSIDVVLEARPDNWILQNASLAAVLSVGAHAFIPDSVRARGFLRLELHGITLTTRYDEVFRKKFLGAKYVRRDVRVQFDSHLFRRSTGELISMRRQNLSCADTVALDHVPALELPFSPSTHAELPDEPLLDKLVEPLVILGATGTVILLLFKIRS